MNSVQCPDCGQPNQPEAEVCSSCALLLGQRCGACGQANSSTAAFCRQCGVALRPPTASWPSGPEATPPRYELPKKSSRARYFVVGVIAVVLIFAGLAYIGAKSDKKDKKDALASSQTATSFEAGWKAFSEGPFTGAIHEGWLANYIEPSNLKKMTLPSDVPQSVKDNVDKFVKSGQKLLLIYIDFDPKFATNMNLIEACDATTVKLAGDSQAILNYFRSNGIQASVGGSVDYRGKKLDLFVAKVSAAVDSYQTYVPLHGCVTIVTMTTRSGDSSNVDSLKYFVANLGHSD